MSNWRSARYHSPVLAKSRVAGSSFCALVCKAVGYFGLVGNATASKYTVKSCGTEAWLPWQVSFGTCAVVGVGAVVVGVVGSTVLDDWLHAAKHTKSIKVALRIRMSLPRQSAGITSVRVAYELAAALRRGGNCSTRQVGLTHAERQVWAGRSKKAIGHNGRIGSLLGPSGGEVDTCRGASTGMNLSVLVEGDAFFRFRCNGVIDPCLPEANDQNTIVTQVARIAAGGFARGWLPTIYDGLIGCGYSTSSWPRAALSRSTTWWYSLLRTPAWSVCSLGGTMGSRTRRQYGTCTISSLAGHPQIDPSSVRSTITCPALDVRP